MAPRRGFDIPYGKIVNKDSGEPDPSMTEFMDQVSQALTTIKTAVSNMTTLDASAATASDCANAWESFRADIQGIE